MAEPAYYLKNPVYQALRRDYRRRELELDRDQAERSRLVDKVDELSASIVGHAAAISELKCFAEQMNWNLGDTRG